MGNWTSSDTSLSPDKLNEYQEVTFFTKKEILYVHRKYQSLGGIDNGRLSREKVLLMPELAQNPFKDRICKVFSEDNTGDLAFEDFLDMLSVFSETATRDVKSSYAFRIFDFDNDLYLNKQDLIKTIELLCGRDEDGLQPHEVELIADKILEESDLDGDHQLSYVEFEHVVERAPDFAENFRMRI
ncbi:uncharacterized protein MONBRDRAFT_14080 [Monosiga brevicollis MX1]|uniref:EF-hand domain-containing protein n=1 Tax=Monosiga brevicollis TaxID=81824 RepID=A9UNK7_MONBE|nr:uncharacterized protein MONBRDRAFT_14080 [Monosiga brevicollis MX1]EDQ92712.1 predicted protein [Monosiga brevicollis MX1]|eukprot:XP_001742474.1 hypothetical protein [Monosiga brevicollis MX1]